MMKKLNTTSYPKLRQDLQALLQGGQAKALSLLKKIRAETYWQMGKRLAQTPEVKEIKKIPPQWVEQLTQDLGLSQSVVYRILQFYQTYPKGLPQEDLSWTVHIVLMPLQDEAERSFYLQKAAEQSWSEKQLREALKQKLYQASLLPAGRGKKKTKIKLTRPETGLYLYNAVVERVIDGDTLLVSVDLGFDVWKKQRLRLRAVDCAELKTAEGQAAKAFVQEVLQAVESVVLKTYKVDLHGRFVCDVFFAVGERDKQKIFATGTFLNQLLVEHGHAVVVG